MDNKKMQECLLKLYNTEEWHNLVPYLKELVYENADCKDGRLENMGMKRIIELPERAYQDYIKEIKGKV